MKTFVTCCIDAIGEDITEMVDTCKDITRATFLKHVDRDQQRHIENGLGYVAHSSQGLTMANDYHVSYHKGTYQNNPCVFFVWSCIEHIFV